MALCPFPTVAAWVWWRILTTQLMYGLGSNLGHTGARMCNISSLFSARCNRASVMNSNAAQTAIGTHTRTFCRVKGNVLPGPEFATDAKEDDNDRTGVTAGRTIRSGVRGTIWIGLEPVRSSGAKSRPGPRAGSVGWSVHSLQFLVAIIVFIIFNVIVVVVVVIVVVDVKKPEPYGV
uniref:Uncharacterized protein n=1 Tax=Anopheles farauti TaxID=69004 RepID=A0A182QR67_9DIPT